MFAASKSGKFTAGAAPTTDPSFAYVPLLLNTGSTNGQQNNTFLDSSTNNFTITRNGTPTQGSRTPYWPNGQWSNYFNGSTDWLSSTASTILQFGSNPYTIEGWVYQTSRSGTPFICGGVFSGTGLQVAIDSSGFIYVSIPGVANLTAATIAIPLNTWTHFACVRTSTSAGGFTYYINGVAAGTPTDANNYSGTSTTFNVATTNNSSLYVLTGYLSNFRIVKGVAVYTGAFTPSTSPLAATQSGNGGTIQAITGTATALLTCQSNRFRDNSSNAFAITANGTPTVQAFQPFSPAASYSAATYAGSGYFPGSSSLTAAYNAAFDLAAVDFTIETWALTTDSSSNYPSMVGRWQSSGNACWDFRPRSLDIGNFFCFVYSTNGTAATLVNSSTSISDGAWHHLVAVRSGNNFALFVDGVRKATANFSGVTIFNSASAPLNVGYDPFGATYYNGYLSNTRVVKGTAVYDPTLTTLTVPTTPVTNVTNTSLLLNMANAGIYDAAAQNDITTVGGVQVSTAQKQWLPSSTSFNGSTGYLTAPSNPVFAFGSANFTIEFWLYANAIPTNPLIAQLYDTRPASTNGAYILIYLDNDGAIKLWVNSANRITSSVISTGAWYYVALTRSSGLTKLFLNGTQTGSTYTDSTVYLAGAPFIGASYSAGAAIANFFNGYIQDFRITRGVGRTITASPTAAFPTR